MLLTGALKLLGPLYLVPPEILAYALFAEEIATNDQAYGVLVNRILPTYLVGFFAAALLGAILSSFNSALNSARTLFSLGVYKKAQARCLRPRGCLVGTYCRYPPRPRCRICRSVPCPDQCHFCLSAEDERYLLYPHFAVVFVGMVSRRVTARATKFGLTAGLVIIATGYFVWPFNLIVAQIHEFHFLGLTFAWLVLLILIISDMQPPKTGWEIPDAKAVDMTPGKHARLAALMLILLVLTIYGTLSEFPCWVEAVCPTLYHQVTRGSGVSSEDPEKRS